MTIHESLKFRYVRVAIVIFLVPIVLQVVALTWIMTVPDRSVTALLDFLNLKWFSWPSIRNIGNDAAYDRMRLSVAISLAFGIVMLLLNSFLLILLGDANARDKLPTKEIFMSLMFPVSCGLVVFVLPHAYVSTRVGDNWVISPDIFGVFCLTILTLCVSLFGILPVFGLFNLFSRLFIARVK